MKGKILNILFAVLLLAGAATSCIEPPLKLASVDGLLDEPEIVVDMEAILDIDVDWKHDWYYGWDDEDIKIWGPVEYPEPKAFEVRRYYLGPEPGAKHTEVDGFPVEGNSFHRTYQFGYYDMLLWSKADPQYESQSLVVDDSSLDEVFATTTVTHSIALTKAQEPKLTALYNQPEPFFSAYAQDLFISRYKKDYDYYDEARRLWVKKINTTLEPRTYFYLVQIILQKNDGRVKGVTGDCALSAMASSVSVNTGKTSDTPGIVYFNTRLKKDLVVNGEKVDIIGGKLSTFGLCGMKGYEFDKSREYHGPFDFPNYLYYELNMASEGTIPIRVDVTDQVRSQCHGGVITIWLDVTTLDNPGGEGQGSMFRPVIDDYENLDYDIPLG